MLDASEVSVDGDGGGQRRPAGIINSVEDWNQGPKG